MSATRKAHTPAQFGGVTVKPNQLDPDKNEFDYLPVNRASDGDLAEALARRGYDVTCAAVSPEAMQRRTTAWEKKQTAKAKRGAR